MYRCICTYITSSQHAFKSKLATVGCCLCLVALVSLSHKLLLYFPFLFLCRSARSASGWNKTRKQKENKSKLEKRESSNDFMHIYFECMHLLLHTGDL